MWQRFTERSRRVVFFAQEEAGRLGQDFVTPEHLLFGLVRDEGNVAISVLERLGLTCEMIRNELAALINTSNGQRTGTDMQLSPKAKRVIDLSYDEARQLNNNYIGTEHLLLGLLREQISPASKILLRLRATLENARGVVQEIQAIKKHDDAKREEAIQELVSGRMQPGDLGTAQAGEGRKHVEIALDAETYLKLVAAYRAKDAHGYRQLTHGDQTLFMIPNGARLKLLVTPTDSPYSEKAAAAGGVYVRILQGAYETYAGWMFGDWFDREKADDAPFPPPLD